MDMNVEYFSTTNRDTFEADVNAKIEQVLSSHSHAQIIDIQFTECVNDGEHFISAYIIWTI